MSRIDRARLDGAALPFHIVVPPRFSDLDTIGHINNVAVALILQEGRIRMLHANELADGRQLHLVVASLHIEFAADLLYGTPIEVACGILEIGRTSFRVGQVARQDGTAGAYAEVVLVTRDGGGPVPVPEAQRAKLEQLRI